MKKFAEQKRSSKGLLEVQRVEANLFVFIFQSEESKHLRSVPPLVWKPSTLSLAVNLDKPLQMLNLNAVHLWVKLPKLRPHYFNAHVLDGLGSLVGKPLFMDKPTTTETTVAYSRIYLEIKAGEIPLPHPQQT